MRHRGLGQRWSTGRNLRRSPSVRFRN